MSFNVVKACTGKGVTVGSSVAVGAGVLLPHSGIVGMIKGVRPGRGVSVAGTVSDGVWVAAGVGATGVPDGLHALLKRMINRVKWASFMENLFDPENE